MSQNIFDFKREFLQYLEIEKGRSLKTIANYDRYISRFLDFSGAKFPAEISLVKVREFRLFLNRQKIQARTVTNKTLKKNTQNYYLIALRSFLKYLSKNDIETLAAEKVELAKTQQRELNLITKEEFQQLMAEPLKNKEFNFLNLRDQAILETLFSTGLRVSELCSLNQDLNLKVDEFSIRGKGEKIRIVFLSEKVKKYIKKYLEQRERDFQDGKIKNLSAALFISKKGSRIIPRTIQRMIEKRAKSAGIFSQVTPHTIRHCFATDLLQNGADIRSVQLLLGHSSINTTQVYTNISDLFLKKVHQEFHSKK